MSRSNHLRLSVQTRARAAIMGSLFLGLSSCGDGTTDAGPLSLGGAGGVGGGAANAGATSAGASSSSGGAGNGPGGSAGTSAAGSGGNGGSGGGWAGGSGGSASSAGAASGAGAGGGGGSSPYNPCPTNGDACRIMPLGDSITDGCCGENTKSMGASYRLTLFQRAIAEQKQLSFVGSGQSGPNQVSNATFPRHHEGHPGWTIADGGGRSGLQTPIVGWLKATPPDIVTLMIGTNDIDIRYELPKAPERLGTLIDTIAAQVPKALIVVALVVPTRKDDENIRDQTFNAALPALIKARADAGKHVRLVDMYGAFTKNTNYKTELLANDLHPSDAGYAVIANVWWDAIGGLLPK